MNRNKSLLRCIHFFLIAVLLQACNSGQANQNTSDPVRDRRAASKNYETFTKEAQDFCIKRKLNRDYFFLIDLSKHSGEKRFFVYDFNQQKLTDSFLVSHGCGNNPWSKTDSRHRAEVSNEDGSHCSSIGKYALLDRSYSEWGVHVKYLMKGLERTNSNAMKRQIVFHSWSKIGDEEVFPEGTPEGWGCPAISDRSFLILDERLKKSRSNTLMWIIQ